MSMTYLGDLSTDLDQVRFAIQDTTSGSGVKPNGVNFTDEEILGLLAIEDTVGRTVAACYEVLATAWAQYVDTRIGPRDEKLSQISERYRQRAATERQTHGYNTGNNVLSVGLFDEGISADDTDI